MKRILFITAILMATVSGLKAAPVDVNGARQVADRFFSTMKPRLSAGAGQSATRLAYTAAHDRFYVFNHGTEGGFVVVAGDDRLPQVLGYGDKGDFAPAELPPAVKYWMDAMDRQIAFLQAHPEVAAHQPAKRVHPVAPLMTTRWDQESPYNDLCPTYTDANGNTNRAVTGCVATATAQVMNYHQWPPVGTGSHSYHCNVNDMTPTDLSADFSQSVYRWDLMLDTYDNNSSPESCEAVAKLMSDVGISVDMGYGSSSGARESAAMRALHRYFGYSDRSYLLNRDFFGAQEWDQLLVDEITAGRPIIYCGYDFSDDGGGHAFVLDGVDANGYFHVNWGWGGHYDGYFVVSALAPRSGMNFKYMQDGMFGVIPEPQADAVEDFIYVYSTLEAQTSSAPLGNEIRLEIEDVYVQGNMSDTTGYDIINNRRRYYTIIPLSLGLVDHNGTELQNDRLDYKCYLDDYWSSTVSEFRLNLPSDLEEGEYKLKLTYSVDGGAHYDRQAYGPGSKETHLSMVVTGDTAYLSYPFLSNYYSADSFDLPQTITSNQPFDVDVTVSYPSWSESSVGPMGNIYLAVLKDGVEVSTSELYEVQLPGNTPTTCHMQLTAPAQWGHYVLMLKDESGNCIRKLDGWFPADEDESCAPIFVMPPCKALTEDFESMTANSSTSDKNVQGQFTTWNFSKSGVRAPGEGRCNGTNSVMMKKASTFYNNQPLAYNMIMAQATFFNQSGSAAKYTLEYSFDDGASWQKAATIDNESATMVPEKSVVTGRWILNITAGRPAIFRVAMIAGTATTYVDDFILYYSDSMGDVNYDGELSIADVNLVINMILNGGTVAAADVNGDGEVGIADVNALIDLILAK